MLPENTPLDPIRSDDPMRSGPKVLNAGFTLGSQSSWRCPEDRGCNWLNRPSYRPELIPAKAHSETGCLTTNHAADSNELERNQLIQERRPLYTYFQFFTHIQLVSRNNQHATTTQIHGLADSQVKLWAENPVAGLQHQRVAHLRPAFHLDQLNGRFQ